MLLTIRKRIWSWWKDVQFDAGYVAHFEGGPVWFRTIEMIVWDVRHKVVIAVRCSNGHSFIEVEADPENGYSFFVCEGCGEETGGYW